MRVPTPSHPATWVTVADLVPGDLVVMRTRTLRVITKPVTGLIPAGKGRTQVMVDGVTHYPHASATAPVLVLR